MFCVTCRSFFLFLRLMPRPPASNIQVDAHNLHSKHLNRVVKVDCYYPTQITDFSELSLLLINDGQDLRTMKFEDILSRLYRSEEMAPVLYVGMHCSTDRKNEYGTAGFLDYKGRGAKAGLYTRFVMEELIPFIRQQYEIRSFLQKSFAGFSLGGLSALDIVWNHPQEFFIAAVFSGSLWWRDKDQDDEDFDEEQHRIMHRQVRDGGYYPWLKFFFEVGTQDETNDRNNNGIIDAIDDTVSLIDELKKKGYDPELDIRYFELADGRHDVPTWARAFPTFLRWAWGKTELNRIDSDLAS